MKKIAALFWALAIAVCSMAQTPEEILKNMEKAMDAGEAEGLIMTIEMKIPILGTSATKTYTLGGKTRMEMEIMGDKAILWTDGTTSWSYDSKDNKITIENAGKSSDSSTGDEAEMFNGITDGYDISIDKETDQAWYIKCKKSRANKDKDAPKTMELVVAKGSYNPISLSAKVSGVSMTIKDLSFGVKETDVTFNAKDYPGATIEDKR